MGTTWVPDTSHMTAIEFLRKELDGERVKIVDHSVKGNTAYLAMTDGAGEVFGMVVELSRYDGGWSYKEITEDMGPYQCECPLRILDKLSPTTDKNALEWRQACRDNQSRAKSNRKRLQVGQKIRFAKPLPFSDGTRESEFTVVKIYHRGKNITAYQAPSGKNYRITNIAKREFSLA